MSFVPCPAIRAGPGRAVPNRSAAHRTDHYAVQHRHGHLPFLSATLARPASRADLRCPGRRRQHSRPCRLDHGRRDETSVGCQLPHNLRPSANLLPTESLPGRLHPRPEQRLADLAKPTYDLLREALRQSHVVHADETGWRVGRQNAWLWVFSSKAATIYVIRTGKGARSHQVPEDILGPDFDGYLVVDALKSYDVLEVAKGRCNGHLLRRRKELRDTVTTPE